jgi:hypothetical protein
MAQNYQCQIIVPGFSLTVLVSLSASQKCVRGLLRLRSVEGAEAWPAQPDGRGGVRLTLDRKALDQLTAPRGPGESYSDVILRLARPCVVRDSSWTPSACSTRELSAYD